MTRSVIESMLGSLSSTYLVHDEISYFLHLSRKRRDIGVNVRRSSRTVPAIFV